VVGILNDTVNRTYLNALGLIEMTHALCAEIGIDLVDLVALRDGTVGAFGFANVAVDTFVGDDQGHYVAP
jgi:hypothetical protein